MRKKLHVESNFIMCFHDAFIIFKISSSRFTSEKTKIFWDKQIKETI